MKLVIVVLLGLFSFGFAQTKCVTPNSEEAWCVSILDCETLRGGLASNATREANEFIQESLCGYKERPFLFVCCGTKDKFTYNRDPKSHKNFGLLPSTCGDDMSDNKLIGGTEARLDQFPWLALLEYRKNGKSTGHKCEGVLINDRYVLTAAHCVLEEGTAPAEKLFRVRLGEHNLTTDPDCDDIKDTNSCTEPHQDIEVEEIIASPRYARDGQYHNIALVRLANPATFKINVQPICLPLNGEQSAIGDQLTLAGWIKDTNSSMSEVKEKYKVSVVDLESCGNRYLKANRHLLDSQFCAEGDQDFCISHSGAPLVKRLPKSLRFYVEGILSFGPKKCSSTLASYPKVYNKVSNYLIWILDNLKP